MDARSDTDNPDEGSTDSSIKLFICYRRSDGQDAAGRLAYALIRLVPLNEEEVFVDTESLTVGQRWKQAIHDVIVSRDALIAVISPDWTVPDEDERLRIRKPNDPVRVELETAMEAGIPIFPVRVGGARMPTASELPRSLKDLPDLHAIELRHEHYSGDVKRVVDALKTAPMRRTREADSRPRVRPRRPLVRPRLAAVPDGTQPGLISTPAPDAGVGGLLRPIGQWTDAERDAWFVDIKERATAEEKRKAETRAARPKFYETGAWRLAVAVTVLATTAAVVVADFTLQWALGLFGVSVSDTGPLAIIGFALVWSATYVALGTVFYADDPGRGTRVFYTRGILGGWVLAFEDIEEGAGFLGAYPVNIIVGWVLARGAAAAADAVWGVDQIGIFLLLLGVLTLVSLAIYAINTIDQL
jgi:hypothetical protein